MIRAKVESSDTGNIICIMNQYGEVISRSEPGESKHIFEDLVYFITPTSDEIFITLESINSKFSKETIKTN